jgi:hypothetical protein
MTRGVCSIRRRKYELRTRIVFFIGVLHTLSAIPSSGLLIFPLKVRVGQTQAWMATYVSILRILQMI